MLTQYYRAPTLLLFSLLVFDAVKDLHFFPLYQSSQLTENTPTTQLTAGVSQGVRAVAEAQEKASSHCGVCSRQKQLSGSLPESTHVTLFAQRV